MPITAVIDEQLVNVTSGGVSKILSLENFTSALQEISTEERQATGIILPQNCSMISHSSTEIQALLHYPETRRAVKFHHSDDGLIDFEDIPFPNILIHIRFRRSNSRDNYAIHKVKYYMTRYSPREFTPVFPSGPDRGRGYVALALPNMYSNAHICMGGNSHLPPMNGTDLRGFHWYYELLHASPFNSDLDVPGADSYRPYEWLEHLNGKEQFPYDYFGL